MCLETLLVRFSCGTKCTTDSLTPNQIEISELLAQQIRLNRTIFFLPIHSVCWIKLHFFVFRAICFELNISKLNTEKSTRCRCLCLHTSTHTTICWNYRTYTSYLFSVFAIQFFFLCFCLYCFHWKMQVRNTSAAAAAVLWLLLLSNGVKQSVMRKEKKLKLFCFLCVCVFVIAAKKSRYEQYENSYTQRHNKTEN